MKSLSEYIMEAGTPKGFLTTEKTKKLYKSLVIDDRERLEDMDRRMVYKNHVPSFEDIVKLFSEHPDYKDRVDDYFEYVSGWLKNINLTPNDIIMAYSLARSGKQSKIEVIATVVRAVMVTK